MGQKETHEFGVITILLSITDADGMGQWSCPICPLQLHWHVTCAAAASDASDVPAIPANETLYVVYKISRGVIL